MRVTERTDRSSGWELVDLHNLNALLADTAAQRGDGHDAPATSVQSTPPADAVQAAPSRVVDHPSRRPAQFAGSRTRRNRPSNAAAMRPGEQEDYGLPSRHATDTDDRLYGVIPANDPADQPVRPDALRSGPPAAEYGQVALQRPPSKADTYDGATRVLAVMSRLAIQQRQRCLAWMMPLTAAA